MARKSADAPIEMKASHVKETIKKIEAANDDKESAKGTYRNRCGQIERRIDSIVEEAARKGIPSKPLKLVIKIRARRMKAQAIINECEPDERAAMQMIIELNNDADDLPLFAAAREREEASGETSSEALAALH